MKPQKLTDSCFLHDHFFYFNLHKRTWSAKCGRSERAEFSALSAQGRSFPVPAVKGRVTGHVDTALLFDVTAKVSEAGRQRVIREKRKNVHAGLIAATACINPAGSIYTTANTWGIRYNPYDLPYFHNRDNRQRLDSVRVVWLGTIALPSGTVVPTAWYGQYAYYAGSTVFLHFDDVEHWAGANSYNGHIDRNDGTRLWFNEGCFYGTGRTKSFESPDSPNYATSAT